MKNIFANFIIGVVGTAGALTWPEVAATCAGFATCAWMVVQCVIAIRRASGSACSRKNCGKRVEL